MSIVVVGASGGIGSAVARTLARAGHAVWGTARRTHALPDGLAGHTRLDLRDPEAPARLAADLPFDRVDLLVHAAGVNGDSQGSPPEAARTLDALRADVVLDLVHVNAVAPVLITRALAPRLAGGTVLLLTSRRGSLSAKVDGGNYGYCASKAALNMMGRTLAHDLAPQGTRVLLVHPGVVATPMGGPEAHLTPDDAAAALIALVHDARDGDSGRFLRWDGTEHPW